MVIRMLNKLRGSVDELSENFNKEKENIKMEMENIKNIRSEMKNTITEINNTLQEINSGTDESEDQISSLEDNKAENTQLEHPKEKRIQKSETSLRSLWDNLKSTNICIMKWEEERESKELKTYLKK